MTSHILLYLTSNLSDDAIQATEHALSELNQEHWSVGPPYLVNETDDSSCSLPEDLPIRTVGIEMPFDERTSVEEIKALVRAVARITSATELAFEVEIDNTYAGRVANGHPDRILQTGLIDTWTVSVRPIAVG